MYLLRRPGLLGSVKLAMYCDFCKYSMDTVETQARMLKESASCLQNVVQARTLP